MPSIAVHFAVAARLAERLGITDLPSYCLGVIAPDSVNADGFASAEARYGAHIRSGDYDEWKANIIRYSAEHTADYAGDPDFFKGFLLHLYTDIAWDEEVQPELFAYLRSRGTAESELNSEKWNELRGFDSVLSKSPEYKQSIGYLRQAKPTSVTTVSPEQMEKWQRKIVALEYPYPPAEFLNEEHIERTAEKALAYMV